MDFWVPLVTVGLVGMLAAIWTYRAVWHDRDPYREDLNRRLKRLERGSWHP
jgi:hypothetical protein